jgi:hypothetical protein
MKRAAIAFCALCLLALPIPALASQGEYATAYKYTVRFYPRWFTWTQGGFTETRNRLAAPIGMGPEFKVVVAINDDTLYAQAFLDLSEGPQILTLPAYPNIYSILQLDVFGNVIETDLSPSASGGTYGLVGPDDESPLPDGVTRVELPYDSTILIIRTDKYSPRGDVQIRAAAEFRAAMQLQSLPDWQTDPTGGRTLHLPLEIYNVPIKRMADEELAFAPVAFLNTLQEAMASSTTRPLTASDRALIRRFNRLFNAAKQTTGGSGRALADIIRGAQAAHMALIDRWQSHKGPTNWIHFDNIGRWGTSYLDRAALTEYIQLGNDCDAAYYAHVFVDEYGIPLDGSLAKYAIHFEPDQIPEAERFWSVTAYTPFDVGLVPNPFDKYLVASYTPGLVTNPDGSITIYIQPDPPTLEPMANWLPIPAGPFNLMLRAYGPRGATLDGTYVPPAVHHRLFGM